jgi:CheY-like chemotaxis protein
MISDRHRPIMIVEDSLADIHLVKAALRKNLLVNDLIILRDGVEALDYLCRRGQFETKQCRVPLFILLDLKMPKVGGLEVLRYLRADENLKTIPVVILTSSKEEADLEKSYRNGANAYVVKPVSFHEFVEAIGQTAIFWGWFNEPPSIPP